MLKKEAKWYADPCWQPVYKHNASGHSISGNRTELVNKIQSGYRVKVLFRNMSLEADEILIRQEGQVQHVCVSLLNDLSKPTIDTFDAGLSWVWRQCCTTGRCETLKYQVGANVLTHSSIEAETITWFVDSPRNWIPVLSVATDGTVISGSKAALTNAIRAGSEVRYNLVDVYTDEPGFSIAHQADNVAIDGTEVGAMHVRAISVSREGDYEISFQSKPYWWFTIITTTGRLERSRWTVGVHEARPHDSRQIAVDWFVNGSA